jgi:hypothetical protein
MKRANYFPSRLELLIKPGSPLESAINEDLCEAIRLAIDGTVRAGDKIIFRLAEDMVDIRLGGRQSLFWKTQ